MHQKGNVSACARRASMRDAGIRTSLCIKKNPGLSPGVHYSKEETVS
jgi:hypothetical protein